MSTGQRLDDDEGPIVTDAVIRAVGASAVNNNS